MFKILDTEAKQRRKHLREQKNPSENVFKKITGSKLEFLNTFWHVSWDYESWNISNHDRRGDQPF